ncbi:hypothetical protein B0F90DRAFT_1682745 [Multifurca ochricompacta]|uniref:Uncharacterized protein n=1 Tax=Multifurca ochricompacta TaxID=376703 RepID=A0AAD4MAL4_9AGAM|nr:hypothetical protein B0F90DRAFT_1682745 [Multifurca ochricompacta]
MSILSGVVAMNLDSTGHEEPLTPSRDPASSPVVHIQWQNSQSACAAMEELRAASSVPLRPPKPLTFDFELPASSGSSSTSDPFLSSRTRNRSVRSRALGRVQSHSQNDVLAIPAADASKFLDMLGRASARLDENSRKRMRTREYGVKAEREGARAQMSSSKGKERMRTKIVTHSMDELYDHTNLVRDTQDAGVHHSSLPIMQSRDSLSQGGVAFPEKVEDVQVHSDADTPATIASSDGDAKLPSQTHSRDETQHVPSRPSTMWKSQKQAYPPSPTPVRSTPTTFRPVSAPMQKVTTNGSAVVPIKPTPVPLACPTSAFFQHRHPMPAPTPPPFGMGGSSIPITPNRSRAAARMTRTPLLPSLPLSSLSSSSSSCSNTMHSAAVKKPFRPPLARNAPGSANVIASRFSSVPPSSMREPKPVPQQQKPQRQRQRQQQQQQQLEQEGGKKNTEAWCTGSDPDSSFDMSFDFDPEALEAAMRKFD